MILKLSTKEFQDSSLPNILLPKASTENAKVLSTFGDKIENAFLRQKDIFMVTLQGLGTKWLGVAAYLRGLWTIAPWAEGHTKLVYNKLKTQDWKTSFKHLPNQPYIKDT